MLFTLVLDQTVSGRHTQRKHTKSSAKFVWGLCDAKKRNPCSSPFNVIFQGSTCHGPMGSDEEGDHCEEETEPTWGFDEVARRCVEVSCCDCYPNNFVTEELCMKTCT